MSETAVSTQHIQVFVSFGIPVLHINVITLNLLTSDYRLTGCWSSSQIISSFTTFRCRSVKLPHAPVRCRDLFSGTTQWQKKPTLCPCRMKYIQGASISQQHRGSRGRKQSRASERERTSCEMRWIFVCLTGNIQPVFFSISETVVSASQHYCQADLWWNHSNFPSSCSPYGYIHRQYVQHLEEAHF